MADVSETEQTDGAVRVRPAGTLSANDNAAKRRGGDDRDANIGGPGGEAASRPGHPTCAFLTASPETVALVRRSLDWLSFREGAVRSGAASPGSVAEGGENTGPSTVRKAAPPPPRRRHPEGRRGFPSARGRTPKSGSGRAPSV